MIMTMKRRRTVTHPQTLKGFGYALRRRIHRCHVCSSKRTLERMDSFLCASSDASNERTREKNGNETMGRTRRRASGSSRAVVDRRRRLRCFRSFIVRGLVLVLRNDFVCVNSVVSKQKKRSLRVRTAALYVAFPSDEDERNPVTEEGVLSLSFCFPSYASSCIRRGARTYIVKGLA